MKVNITDQGLSLEEGSDALAKVNVNLTWEALMAGIYTAKEFVRFILPGGYRQPMRSFHEVQEKRLSS